MEHHLQDWQHSAMYLAFLLSGCVDVLSHYAKMPSGIEHVSLGPCVASLGFNLPQQPVELCQDAQRHTSCEPLMDAVFRGCAVLNVCAACMVHAARCSAAWCCSMSLLWCHWYAVQANSCSLVSAPLPHTCL